MQLQLFDTWEEDNKTLINYYQGTWKQSLWNENIWYLQTEIGYTTTDAYERSEHHGSLLPSKIYIK